MMAWGARVRREEGKELPVGQRAEGRVDNQAGRTSTPQSKEHLDLMGGSAAVPKSTHERRLHKHLSALCSEQCITINSFNKSGF